jgi:hypothetical protein
MSGRTILGFFNYSKLQGLTHNKSVNISSPIIEIFRGTNAQMVLRYEKSNDLALITQDLLEIDNIEGTFDSPATRQDMLADGFVHSLDTSYLLWVRGGGNLTVVCRKQFLSVNTIHDFFTYNGYNTKPVSGCATRDASKIFAVSFLVDSNVQIGHYYESGSKYEKLKVTKLKKIFPEL